MKKPDATTVILKDNFKEKIWHLDVDLLNVGRATKNKFIKYNINTIGDLALADPIFTSLGKENELVS